MKEKKRMGKSVYGQRMIQWSDKEEGLEGVGELSSG
jgi:hypothetical protein